MTLVDLSKRYYLCDVCGEMKPWTSDSRTYGSKALDEYYGLKGCLVVCSEACMMLVKDPEALLKKKLGVE